MRPDAILLDEMLAAIQRIHEYVQQAGGDKTQFLTTHSLYRAAQMEFVELGEAAGLVSEATRNRFPDVPWRLMKDFRNFITHRYFEVRPEELWNTIEISLPDLERQLAHILSTLP